MKKFLILLLFLIGCTNNTNSNVIKFGVDVTNPPYAYIENGELKGFNIDLSNEIAKQLNKKAEFHVMPWNSILPALHNGKIDAVAAITPTNERKRNMDFSNSYYFDYITVVFRNHNIINDKSDLENKKIACVLGTQSDIYLKTNFNNITLIHTDSNATLIELLKANHVDAIALEKQPAILYTKNNTNLSYKIIEVIKEGDTIAVTPNSPLLPKINQALYDLERNGVIKKLENKWLK